MKAMKRIELTEEDIETVCKMISGKKLKEEFKRYPKLFNKVKPGFRPERLSDSDAEAVAVENTIFRRPIVFKWINEQLKRIQCHIDELETQGKSYGMALDEALNATGFSEQKELYFKLAGKTEVTVTDYIEKSQVIEPPIKTDGDNVDKLNGISSQKQSVENPMKVIGKIINQSLKKRKRVFKREDYKNLRDFVHDSANGIPEQIRKDCNCSVSETEQLLGQFIENAHNYVDGKSIEDQVIISLIKANEELMNRVKGSIKADLEKRNEKFISEANEELKLYEEDLNATKKSCADKQADLNKMNEKIRELNEEFESKKKLVDETEIKFLNAIERELEKTAGLIVKNETKLMGMVNLVAEKVSELMTTDIATVQKAIPVANIPERVENCQTSNYETLEGTVGLNGLKQHNCWDDVIATVSINLKGAGVADGYSRGLAAYLCAAYIEKQPLLIVGPNARNIIEAFSAALSGGKHGVLYCEGEFSRNIIRTVDENKEGIVEIVNLLSSTWMNRLPEIFSIKDKFFIVTHPYAEDVQVEPKSLWTFMLPLFTEFFIDKRATGGYRGGRFAENFKNNRDNESERKIQIPKDLAISPLIRGNIECLHDIMCRIYDAIKSDDEFIFLLLPIAYVTMDTNILREKVEKDGHISEDTKNRLMFVLGNTNANV